eukprot:COSAG01_NODE_16766_length_1206_cov_2.518519_2_plen_200_part_00
MWRRAILPHRRASRPAGARPSREELSETRKAVSFATVATAHHLCRKPRSGASWAAKGQRQRQRRCRQRRRRQHTTGANVLTFHRPPPATTIAAPGHTSRQLPWGHPPSTATTKRPPVRWPAPARITRMAPTRAVYAWRRRAATRQRSAQSRRWSCSQHRSRSSDDGAPACSSGGGGCGCGNSGSAGGGRDGSEEAERTA